MNRAVSTVVAALLAAACFTQQTASSPVKIMSFNIDCRLCDLQHENGDSWADRVDNVKDTISRHNPDIIGIQEPMFKLDVKQLLPAGYKALFNNDTQWLPWGAYPDASIFYRDSRFTATDFQYFWLGPDPTFPRGWDKLTLPRLAVYALMQDSSSAEGDTAPYFYFGSTHFDHGDDMEGSNIDCTQSAYEVLNFSTPLADKYPLLWTGDFNSKTADNNAYAILTNDTAAMHLQDSYYESETDFQISTNVDPAPAYDYDSSIDHIFHANNAPAVATYEVLDWTVDMYVYGEKQQYASDHWAIISSINIKSSK